LAAFALLRDREASASSHDAGDRFSPWLSTDGWRLGGRATLALSLTWQTEQVAVVASWCEGGYRFDIEGETIVVRGAIDRDGSLTARIGDVVRHARTDTRDGLCTILVDFCEHQIRFVDPLRAKGAEQAEGGHLASNLPGVVVAVPAVVGAVVEKGALLVAIEAMKMEHSVTAPHAGRVQAVNVKTGDQVVAGTELVVLEAVP
jgi:3-methylcrotonyl-CoA carboxylase alpha subunit